MIAMLVCTSQLPPAAMPMLARLIAIGLLLIGVGVALAVGLRGGRRASGPTIAAARDVVARSDGAGPQLQARESRRDDRHTDATLDRGRPVVHPLADTAAPVAPEPWSPPAHTSPDRWRMREVLSERAPETTYGLSGSVIATFGHVLARSRRRRAAEEHVATELRNLALGHWLVERDVVFDGGRVPFVIVGPTGIALLVATDGRWDVEELVGLARLSAHVRERLAGYEGRVHAGICLAFDRLPPRAWYGGLGDDGLGGWILGANWLLLWLYGLPTKQGADVCDIEALNKAAGPHWTRRSTARLPEIQRFG